MMSSERRVVSGDRIITILLVFSALGPIAGAVLFALVLTIAGIFSLGPGAIAPMYLGFWLRRCMLLSEYPFFWPACFTP
jgi:hypothetical protein